ncbi:MAG: pre-rRNA processing protein [Vezdaea aestivalis]|nr:MAG: pre-rRNA processing protein [Vezdaea aestivalis]
MAAFFSKPASERKRKRKSETDNQRGPKRKLLNGARKPTTSKADRTNRDDSISGSESEDDGPAPLLSDSESVASSDLEDDTGAEQRLRLAQKYLDNLKSEVENEVGFDAADLDRDLIAERLKEDTSESKGRLYRRIANSLRFTSASYTHFRTNEHPITAICANGSFAYSVSKDKQLVKWKIPASSIQARPASPPSDSRKGAKNPPPPRRRPERLLTIKGNGKHSKDDSFQGHTDKILCVAVSDSGAFVATGGLDKRLIIWNSEDLKVLNVFRQHRDAVTGLAFRRGTNQLFSASKDRTIKIWSLDELAYVDTLFGHQDEVVDVAALALEHCVSVGARDRTARLWKVVDETQLVYRGGGGRKKKDGEEAKIYSEGSIDRVAMIDEETFVTGSDNGSIALWNTHKKKSIFTIPVAHGVDPPLSTEAVSGGDLGAVAKIPEPRARWITALAVIPYSDVVVSGSWDGFVRAWRVSEDKRKLEPLGALGLSPDTTLNTSKDITDVEMKMIGVSNGAAKLQGLGSAICRGIINDISIVERGSRGLDGVFVIAAVGTEHRLGRWIERSSNARNGGVIFDVERAFQGYSGLNGHGPALEMTA